MNKTRIRDHKAHYQDRWAVMRHNQKHDQQILLLEDALLLREMPQGRTLALRCIGEMYQRIVPDLHTEPSGLYNNILMVNNPEFRYLEPCEIWAVIKQTADNHLAPNGWMFVSLCLQVLRYDRVNIEPGSLFDAWRHSSGLRVVDTRILLDQARQSFGNIWIYLVNG